VVVLDLVPAIRGSGDRYCLPTPPRVHSERSRGLDGDGSADVAVNHLWAHSTIEIYRGSGDTARPGQTPVAKLEDVYVGCLECAFTSVLFASMTRAQMSYRSPHADRRGPAARAAFARAPRSVAARYATGHCGLWVASHPHPAPRRSSRCRCRLLPKGPILTRKLARLTDQYRLFGSAPAVIVAGPGLNREGDN
jgi:hypothetical protein